MPEVARAWASTTPLRVKLTTGKLKPKSAKPPPVMVKLAGGEGRSIGLGVMEFASVTVTVTVSPLGKVRVKVPWDGVHCPE